jgi:hypothetical protein
VFSARAQRRAKRRPSGTPITVMYSVLKRLL